MIQRKVCLVGDLAVGKTSLFNRFVYNRYSEAYQSTVGVRVQRKVVTVQATELALILWDTEGSQDSTSLRTSYLRGAAAAVIVCDLTRATTILHCAEYAQILRQVNSAIWIAIAGNKLDLISADHANALTALQTAATIGVPLTLSSASTGDGVEALFQQLGEGLTGGSGA